MSEKNKMINGEFYDANDQQLVDDRNNAKELCFDLNNTRPKDIIKQKAIIEKLLNNVSDNYCITPPFWCDYGYNITIGNNFYSNHNLVILDCCKVSFGDDVFIGPNCGFYAATHPIDAKLRNNGAEFAKPIKVGNSVWFGGNVVVMPGVTIGDNVVIGAGSVVTKDIPSNVVAYGNPCIVSKNLDSIDDNA